MKIKATAVRGKDLVAGDLFSTVGPEYWDYYELRKSIGERVYIRTTTPATNAPDMDELVFRIEIER